MEIELPPGLRIGRRIREVQVDANGRPLFFLLCFPCLDRHCCCNVAGSAHQLTLFRALGSALFEIRVAVTRPPPFRSAKGGKNRRDKSVRGRLSEKLGVGRGFG